MSKAGVRGAGVVIVLGIQCADSAKLEQVIKPNLRGLGYGG
jgi:hypothetical protein